MALYAIGDLHLSLGADKPMDVFPGWEGYIERLQQGWLATVSPKDTVVLMGDISWAMSLAGAKEDFAFIHALPGKKILMKGNHDYWWSTVTKMNAFLTECGFDSMCFLHNNSYAVEGVSVCGTRGWLYDVGETHDAKVMARETGRLRASLQAASCETRIAFLHYPPVYATANSPELIAALKGFNVKQCYYGHLHGASIANAVNGERDGIYYKLLSADAIDFTPHLIV